MNGLRGREKGRGGEGIAMGKTGYIGIDIGKEINGIKDEDDGIATMIEMEKGRGVDDVGRRVGVGVKRDVSVMRDLEVGIGVGLEILLIR